MADCDQEMILLLLPGSEPSLERIFCNVGLCQNDIPSHDLKTINWNTHLHSRGFNVNPHIYTNAHLHLHHSMEINHIFMK